MFEEGGGEVVVADAGGAFCCRRGVTQLAHLPNPSRAAQNDRLLWLVPLLPGLRCDSDFVCEVRWVQCTAMRFVARLRPTMIITLPINALIAGHAARP